MFCVVRRFPHNFFMHSFTNHKSGGIPDGLFCNISLRFWVISSKSVARVFILLKIIEIYFYLVWLAVFLFFLLSLGSFFLPPPPGTGLCRSAWRCSTSTPRRSSTATSRPATCSSPSPGRSSWGTSTTGLPGRDACGGGGGLVGMRHGRVFRG